MEYSIPDVSADMVMEVAKILANSAGPMNPDSINTCFVKPLSRSYLSWALSVCCQLGLAEERQALYVGAENLRNDIRRATREQLYVAFEACLKNYPPFLLYIDFASKGYPSTEAAARTKGILNVKGATEIIEQSLRRWGVYAKLIEYDKKSDTVTVKVKIEKLTVEYVQSLLHAFEAELKSKVFFIDMLGPEAYAYMVSRAIKIDDLATALLTFENDSDGATGNATTVLESFLWKLGEDANLDVSSTRGLMQLADLLRKAKPPVILNNQNHIVHGLGAIRNMTHHAQDNETGHSWTITKQAALLTTLFVPCVIRSLYMYRNENKQEL